MGAFWERGRAPPPNSNVPDEMTSRRSDVVMLMKSLWFESKTLWFEVKFTTEFYRAVSPT